MFSLVKPTLMKSAVPADRPLGFSDYLARRELVGRLVPIDYPERSQLCLEGQPAAGVFSICRGQGKEYFTSIGGKTAIIRIVGPGDVIGLEGVFAGSTYATSVEFIEPASAYFVSTRDLLNSMRSDEGFRLAVAKELSERCRCAYHDIRQFGPKVPARLARFLLDRLRETAGSNEELSIKLTREEIAQQIGSTRESVSRLVTLFSRKGWLLINGAKWRIQNRNRLASLATQ